LDYDSMLQKIVATIGQTFEATSCLLRPVEGDRLTQDEFFYRDPESDVSDSLFDRSVLIEKVLETRHYQLAEDVYKGKPSHHLIVPLSYQQHLLAVLALHQWGRDRP
ncbi:MAG: GAF domain-containing protein, partial [Nostoc sp.]